MFFSIFSLTTLVFTNNWNMVYSSCPFYDNGTPPSGVDYSVPDASTYNTALADLDLQSVFKDLYDLINSSDSCWPADEFNGEESYAGLFLRLAWHAAGTFRDTDGEGGVGGGRQRYPPESEWEDNGNLDYARALVGEIKDTYGDALSWGDLFVFAGTAAILQGGGPVTEVCAGRIDNNNGSLSDVLADNSTCNIQGNCSAPLGSSTVGLIYVNPQGYLGIPDPNVTAGHVREVFSRMGMNDSETVALIGGGHAFGKAHGLGCFDNYTTDDGDTDSSSSDYVCTSGIEGQWTTYPFQWDNEFFTQLRDDEYNLTIGPGGAYQWTNLNTGYLMLTTDLALIADSDYKTISLSYANDIDQLNTAFKYAWEKLVTSGGNWADNKFCMDADELTPEAVSDDDDDDDDAAISIYFNNNNNNVCVIVSLLTLLFRNYYF